MDNIRENQFTQISAKGLFLVHAVETGLIEENEDGSVPTEAFERFWDAIESDARLWSKQEVENLCDYGSKHGANKSGKNVKFPFSAFFGGLLGSILTLLLKAVFR